MKKIYNRFLKKVYFVLLITLLILPLFTYTQVFALNLNSELMVVAVFNDTTIIPFAEETKIYYATDELNHVWSLTQGEWLSEWMPIG